MELRSHGELINELARLRAENERLTGLLETHGIAWQPVELMPAHAVSPSAPSSLSTDEKVALLGRLFRGRTDAIRSGGKARPA